MPEHDPHPRDISLGFNIRLRRRQLGLSQAALADRLGITFQQVQKYETGANRVSFSRLTEIADALQVSLFDLIGGAAGPGPDGIESPFQDYAAQLAVSGAVELLADYARIPATGRHAVAQLARTLANPMKDAAE